MIGRIFEEQVRKNPEQVAVHSAVRSLTYDELNRLANRLARQILAKCTEGQSIALLFEHGADMIIGTIAAVKAGQIYVPLDPTYPEDRLEYILQDSSSSVIVTNKMNRELAVRISEGVVGSLQVLLVDEVPQGAIMESLAQKCLDDVSREDNLNHAVQGSQIAYILYTSGSTGRPKGVIQTYENIYHFIRNYTRDYGITAADRLTLFSAFSHDAAIMDIYGALLNGAALFPLNIKDQANLLPLAQWLKSEQITIYHSVPTVFRYFQRNLTGNEEFPNLRWIILGGEQVLEHDIVRFQQLFGAETRLANLYGQSESSYNSAQFFAKDTPFTKITLGQVVEDTELMLVNDEGEEALPLEFGEIVVLSKHIALGYWNDPEKTAKAFGEDEELGRLYWTGDLGRLLLDGSIEFVGRKDFQVKIRGYRVEPGEIENQLYQCTGVKEAAVIAKRDSIGEIYLSAFVVPSAEDVVLSEETLRAYLQKTLPSYMIPSYFTVLEKMPLTPSNKTDRKTLEEMEVFLERGVEYVEPEGSMEKELARIWEEILAVKRIGATANFFALGGHSLKATTLVARVYQDLQMELPLKQVFDTPTIRELALYLETAQQKAYQAIQPVGKRTHYPVSFAQRRIYLICQQAPESTSYNMSNILRVKGALGKAKVQETFRILVQRHEALRTNFGFVDGELVQFVQEDIDFLVEDISLNGVGRGFEPFIRPFDLGVAPLFRVGLASLGEDEYLLMFDIHHIIADGTSIGVLTQEFIQIYTGFRDLPELGIQYKDFTVWQNEHFTSEEVLRQRDFWLKSLDGQLPLLNMPLDYPRPAYQTFEGSTVSSTISTAVMNMLGDVARQENVTLNTLFLAAYATLLHKYTQQTEVVIGSLTAGRDYPDLEHVVGMFANFMPIRLHLPHEEAFKDYLAKVREITLQCYSNSTYPFDQLVEDLQLERDQARNPLFDTMLIFHNEVDFNKSQHIAGLEFSEYNSERGTAKLDFKFDLYPQESGEMTCVLEYNVNLFSAKTMEGLLQRFLMVLEAVGRNSKQSINGIKLFTELEEQELARRRKLNGMQKSKALTLAVSATFTAEPIEEYIQWWLGEFGTEVRVEFASYNQVFQELLTPTSLLSTNPGVNLLLVRFEDWIREDEGLTPYELKAKLERNYREIVQLLLSTEKLIPYFVGIFPVSTHLSFSGEMLEYINQMYLRWKKDLSSVENLYLLDFSQLGELYGISEIFDLQKDKNGHLPFTDEYYAAMGTWIARKVHSWQKQHFKVIVVDCDNTLWQGVCGEDGALGVRVTGPYLELQKFLLEKYEEGMLLAICSKNNEADAFEVFEKNPEMTVLRPEHFVSWRINWQPKVENIREIAQELNLGLDSFIFIDDSMIECSAMMTHCPEVLTLPLPMDADDIPAFLKMVWAFERVKVTEEDRKRTEMYLAEKKRSEAEKTISTLEDFLNSLELEMSMRPLVEGQLARVAQLTQRTNQFNLSTRRRTENELRTLLENPAYHCQVVQVRDRFGEYGLVGVVITEEVEQSLVIDTFLLSCRVLGRGIEKAILTGLRRYCLERGLTRIDAEFIRSAKNKPFLDFIEMSGWELVEAKEDSKKYRLDVFTLPDRIPYIECYFDADFARDVVEEAEVSAIAALDHIAVAVGDINVAREQYVALGYQCSDVVHDPLQNAFLVMCYKVGSDPIELVAPVNEASPSYRILQQNGEIPYHLCYGVKDMEAFLEHLLSCGIDYEVISPAQPAVLFGGRRVMFIYVQGVGLLELLEGEVERVGENGAMPLREVKRVAAGTAKSPEDKAVVVSLNDPTPIATGIELVVPELKLAVEFFTSIGYHQTLSQRDLSRGVVRVTLEKALAGRIELILPLDSISPEQKFLHQNGPHLYRLMLHESIEQMEAAVSRGFAKSVSEREWLSDFTQTDHLLHRQHLLPLIKNTGAKLLQLPIYELYSSNIAEGYSEPTTSTERRLAELWADILRIERVGKKDHFFKLGGHSLRATSLVSRVFKTFGVEITLRDVFEKPILEEMARLIGGERIRGYAIIPTASPRDFYPVSAAQRRLFVLDQFRTKDTAYNLTGAFLVDGVLECQSFEAIFKRLVERHESLRTSFHLVDGVPMQKINQNLEFGIEYHDLTREDLAIDCADSQRLADVVNDFVRPFDLAMAPLLRVGLFKVGKETHLFLYDLHHIIADGISVQLLIEDFLHFSKGEELPALSLQYKDFAVWQSERFARGDFDLQKSFWLNEFAPDCPVSALDFTDYPRRAARTFAGDVVNLTIEESIVGRLKDWLSTEGVTLYMALLAVYNILLARYSNQDDIIIGSPVAGRSHPEVEKIIGMFINTLAFRNKPASDKRFTNFLQEVKAKVLEAQENQDYPFEELIDQLHIERDVNRNPLFDTMFVLQNFERTEFHLAGLHFTPLEWQRQLAKFDLTLQVVEVGEELNCQFHYRTELYRRDTVERMAKNFRQILEGVLREPEAELGNIPILTAEERDVLLHQFNSTYTPLPQKTLTEIFEAEVERQPERVALIANRVTMTYGELNRQANQLAHLLRGKGVKSESIIALRVERSLEMMVGILGILKAGGTYLPIDPAYPQERVEYMLRDSGATLIVTQSHLRLVQSSQELPTQLAIDELSLTGEYTNLSISSPKNLAYVLYTSGSTGKPKGVMIEHHSVVNTISHLQQRFALTSSDRILQSTVYTFDASVREIFWWFFAGASCALLPPDGEKDPYAILQMIERDSVTVIKFVPVMLHELFKVMQTRERQTFASLRYIFVGGEALTREIVDAYFAVFDGRVGQVADHTADGGQSERQDDMASKSGARHTKSKPCSQPTQRPVLCNVYGPTEAAIHCTEHIITAPITQVYAPIGRPISNMSVFVLDAERHLVPQGVRGMIYLAGEGLSRGYINNPTLTNERFTTSSDLPGLRLYNTGDLGRWLPDGTLEYHGRTDFQVKIRGYRIELGEIESKLTHQPEIQSAVVVAQSDIVGNSELIAYIVPKNCANLEIAEIRDRLKTELPDYMIPQHMVILPGLPLTPNGKVDRKSLPAIVQCSDEEKYDPPQTEWEKALAILWEDLLQKTRIGRQENFFEIGGNSMKAISLVVKIHESWGIQLPLREIFTYPTIGTLAVRLEIISKYRKLAEEPVLQLNEANGEAIFFFPPIAGHGVIYDRLAEIIETHTLYSFDFLINEAPIQKYVERILQIQQEGPFILGGYSAGGNLAFEVARELTRQGYQVSELILFDSYIKAEVRQRTEEERLKAVEELLAENAKDPILAKYLTIESLRNEVAERIHRYMNFMDDLVTEGVIHANLHLITAERTGVTSLESGGLADGYGQSTAADRIAPHEEELVTDAEAQQIKAWQKHTTGQVTMHRGKGTHEEMFTATALTINGKFIKQILEQFTNQC